MQPHSIVIVGLTHYIWNATPIRLSMPKTEVVVEYKHRQGHYEKKYYSLTDIKIDPKGREITTRLELKGKDPCEVTARRNSDYKGAEVELFHGVQHASGLREIYNLYEKKLSGRHERSLLYNKFEGRQSSDSDPTRFVIETDVKMPDGNFQRIHYDIKIDPKW
jgi:hypothetical protein